MIQSQHDYNNCAKTYDSVVNKTRDLEACVIKSVLGNASYHSIVELGCGTGKNPLWLAGKCQTLTAGDFSAEMITVARQKVSSANITFKQADITHTWDFPLVSLITCSLILEHIQNLDFVFDQAAKTLNPGGQFYICVLHPG